MRTSILQTATATTTSSLVVASSPTRHGLLFLAPFNTGRVTVNTRPPTADGDGLVLQADSGAVQLTRAEHGDIVSLAWFARAAASSVLVSWIETAEVG